MKIMLINFGRFFCLLQGRATTNVFNYIICFWIYCKYKQHCLMFSKILYINYFDSLKSGLSFHFIKFKFGFNILFYLSGISFSIMKWSGNYWDTIFILAKKGNQLIHLINNYVRIKSVGVYCCLVSFVFITLT